MTSAERTTHLFNKYYYHRPTFTDGTRCFHELCSAHISRGADIGLGIGLFALFAASAAYGYVVTGNCVDVNGGAHHNRPRFYREAPADADPDSPPPPPPGPPASLDRHR